MMNNTINFKELLNQAIEESRYFGSVSFFEDRDKGDVADFLNKAVRIDDAAYIVPKDGEKDEYAVVGYKDAAGVDKFIYVNRNAKDFVKRAAQISKDTKASLQEILEQVKLTLKITKQLKEGETGDFQTIDGIANWYYVYELVTE